MRTSLRCPGWNVGVRTRLESLIRRGKGRGLDAVFDFDNTIVCGDIGEATFAILVRDGLVKPVRGLCPPFVSSSGKRIEARSALDLVGYYEALLAPTVHGAADPTPLASAYCWAVQIMEGLTPKQIVEATRQAFALSRHDRLVPIEVAPGVTSFPAPFFYPETVELIAALQKNDFRVWIVSASNIWSVRWMARHGLNPLLRKLGAPGLPLKQVIGVSTLLQDAKGCLHKDVVVSRQREYRELEPGALSQFTLTSLPEFPVPTYSGKISRILDHVGRMPFLSAGDSPGDLPMLSASQHRLWIERPGKPAFKKAFRAARRLAPSNGWLVQPVVSGEHPGFCS
jgi:hypothetical protein